MPHESEMRFRAALSKLGCNVEEWRDGRSWVAVTSINSYALLSLGMDRENVWRQLLRMVIEHRGGSANNYWMRNRDFAQKSR